MSDSWNTHYDDEIEGRHVTVQTHADYGYKVTTNQGKDDDGTFEVASSSVTHVAPTSAERIVTIDEATIEALHTSLGEIGFSKTGIEKIISHIPT